MTGAYLLTALSSKVERDIRAHVWDQALRGIPVTVRPYARGRWLAVYPLRCAP